MSAIDQAGLPVDLAALPGDAPAPMREAVLNWSRTRKRLVVMTLDSALAVIAVWLAFTLRLDEAHRPVGAEWVAYLASPMLVIAVFARMGLYRAMFRHTGMAVISATGKAIATYGILFAPLIWSLFLWVGVPRSLLVLQPLILLALVATSRTAGSRWFASQGNANGKRLLIYGAGRAGAQTAAALAGTHQYHLLGFLDDDAAKVGRSINGVPVYPPVEAGRLVQKLAVSDVLLALPSVTRARRNGIIGQLQSLPVRIRSLPGLDDLASGRVTLDDFRDLDVDDLLGREPVAPRPELLARSLAKNVVLVTGAGGSIGSELCRQIVREDPAELLLVEHSEFALYRVHQELAGLVARNALGVRLVPLLANVCNAERIAAICRLHGPTTIFHAAAYKHVPMVEGNPGEGIINNVQGTLTLALAAIETKVARFVLVSTDKAVRPTNVMGATKRIAEMMLQSLAADAASAHTCFSMVRFGNVLGSSGSVVPLFRSQIAQGGPLTVTHPDVTRYFMTIPEAAQLVLHAGAMATGGDLFVLDMGSPIRILDLAKRIIGLSGRTVRDEQRPMGDISIEFTGLRPGEKLYEELLIGENPLPTEHPRIIRAREEFLAWPEYQLRLQSLLAAARMEDIEAMKKLLLLLVPGYTPQTALEKTGA